MLRNVCEIESPIYVLLFLEGRGTFNLTMLLATDRAH